MECTQLAWMGRSTLQKVGFLDADLMAVAQAAPAGLVAATTTSTPPPTLTGEKKVKANTIIEMTVATKDNKAWDEQARRPATLFLARSRQRGGKWLASEELKLMNELNEKNGGGGPQV